ncbi:hypothetical protein K488DRAFT_75072 [Vararia minispora EC-137]|uniref:Uncharacterized protein n=1 Tax=Vararia minispora EC-137 TaxID=1314806 RepID=A0ACB8Q5D4_9AGAM|nr:hypothetical protein K488DRAFT_75072 [Vararia minispora EC-137]
MVRSRVRVFINRPTTSSGGLGPSPSHYCPSTDDSSFLWRAHQPNPGFVVKSSVLQPGAYRTENDQVIPISQGLKTFINVAWAIEVPPPPAGAQDSIREVLRSGPLSHVDIPEIPLVTSAGRAATDKAGRPAVVFDAVFHISLKGMALKDAAFKLFLVELALHQVETQTGLQLSRTLGSPNIASKGPILPFTSYIPAALNPSDNPHSTALSRPLVEVLDANRKVDCDEVYPTWSWDRKDDRLHLEIKVPKLTLERIPSAALDLEPQRLLFHVPGLYNLDINLALTDNELKKELVLAGAGPDGVERALMLKRARSLDVDGAVAEWRVNEGRLLVTA